ncbi:MAG: hypothetical protein ACD_78C00242G0002 [uncultured bacterium (gcode 4)]|uniref:Uncharacterized protein n=1 Tax=uncultured bacterium (gcode 4) TaxID=1234023 RepID=K1XXY6_9BACT|nr:MAG: hypothetical protein ACD_78C00242G0002 [uncultured bacterium (gcode 4)]
MMKRRDKDNRIKCLIQRIDIFHIEYLELLISMEFLGFCDHTDRFVYSEIVSWKWGLIQSLDEASIPTPNVE